VVNLFTVLVLGIHSSGNVSLVIDIINSIEFELPIFSRFCMSSWSR